MNLSRMRLFHQYIHQTDIVLSPMRNYNSLTNTTGPASAVRTWLDRNLPPARRAGRQRQLYIQGYPGCGKTTTLRILEESFLCFRPTMGQECWDDFDDKRHQVIILDEFDGKRISHGLLKIILDGSRVSLPNRYVTNVKTKNLPVIICCNSAPEAIYTSLFEKHPVALREFIDRIEVVEFIESYAQLCHVFTLNEDEN